MRLLMFVGLTIGGLIGWWLGGFIGGLFTQLAVSTLGSLVAIYLVYRLTRDYL